MRVGRPEHLLRSRACQPARPTSGEGRPTSAVHSDEPGTRERPPALSAFRSALRPTDEWHPRVMAQSAGAHPTPTRLHSWGWPPYVLERYWFVDGPASGQGPTADRTLRFGETPSRRWLVRLRLGVAVVRFGKFPVTLRRDPDPDRNRLRVSFRTQEKSAR